MEWITRIVFLRNVALILFAILGIVCLVILSRFYELFEIILFFLWLFIPIVLTVKLFSLPIEKILQKDHKALYTKAMATVIVFFLLSGILTNYLVAQFVSTFFLIYIIFINPFISWIVALDLPEQSKRTLSILSFLCIAINIGMYFK